MERIEVQVRKKSTLFVVLSGGSLVLFIAPLLAGPEYFYISGFGVALALIAIVVFALTPKETQVIAEVAGNTLRFRSTKNPLFGIGSLYRPGWQEFDLAAVTKIKAFLLTQSINGADNYVCVTIERGSESDEIFVLGDYRARLLAFLSAISARFPSIEVEEARP